MTTDRLSRLRRRFSKSISASSVRDDHLLPISQTVTTFEDIGGPGSTPTWLMADGDPALFERKPDELEQDLKALWQAQGRSALVPLAEPIAKLADQARANPLASHTEVSSTTYALQ